MIKHFCDLCGEPALENPYQSLRFDKGTKFYVDADFHKQEGGNEKTSDPRGDICGKCLAEGLDMIIDRLKQGMIEHGTKLPQADARVNP